MEEKACVGGDWDRLHTRTILGINQNSKQKALLTSYIHGMSHMSQLCSQFNPFVEGNGMHYWAPQPHICTCQSHSITMRTIKIDFDIEKGWTLRMKKYMEQRTGSVQFHAIHPK